MSVAAVISVLCLLLAGPASAIGVPGFLLTKVSLRESGGTATVTLHFTPGVAPYRVLRQRSPHLFAIALARTTSPAGMSLPSAGRLVTRLAIARSNANLTLRIRTAHSATISIIPGSSRLSIELALAVAPSAPSSPVAEQPSPASTQTRVLPLRYASVDEIAALFSSSTAPGGRSFQTTSILSQAPLNGYGGQSAGTLPGGSLSLDMRNQLGAQRISDSVAIDRRLNAVIVTGNPDLVAGIVSEIQAVDRPDAAQTSVELDAKIFELTSTAARQIGINFSDNGPVASATLLSQSLQKPQIAAVFQAQLFAMIAKGEGKLLSAPRLQTLSGTEASILTGDALPVVTTITYPGNPPTVQQQLQYVNVGVHLQVRPYVSRLGYVTSVVLAEVSNVTGFIQGNIPQISQRQAVATVRVRDGQAFVIGGLLQNNDITSISRVPLLSRIPLFGELFKLSNTTHEVTNLYVVITPHIVTSASQP